MLYRLADFASSTLLYLFCFVFVDISDVGVGLDISPLETWEINEAILTGNTRFPYTTWNGDSSYPDCIFIFGGNVCTDCDTLFCYNITTDTLSEFGSLDSSLSGDRRAGSQKASFITSDDILYYIMDDGEVYNLDLNDNVLSEVLKASIDVTLPCLLKHPSDTEFYVIDGSNGGEFYVYDLVENEIHQGNDMNDARYQPGCVVNDYDEDNPYLYVMGGQSQWIERINVNDARNNEWETLQLILSNGLSDMCSVAVGSLRASSIASYQNYIYLIGGYDGSRENDIFALDVENWEVFWAGLFPTGISSGSASVAEDRVYMIGGYTSGDTDDIYISNAFSEVTDQDITEDDDAISPLETWKLNEAILTGNTRFPYTTWNGDSNYPDCIFIFGGNVCTDCNTLFCYNITSDTLLEFGSLDSSLSGDRRTGSQKASFIISDGDEDLLYYIMDDGDVYYVDLNNPDGNEVLKASFDVDYPCLVKHPGDTEFYVIDGSNGGEFYVYDLEEHEIHQGSDMNDARYQPGCVVNDYDDDNPFIYVLGGQSSWIERMSIKDGEARNNEWETLQLILSNGLSDMCSVAVGSLRASSIASYANFIYLIGGYDGTRENDIFALDVENWELFWAGLFPTGISSGSASVAKDRVYMIGGYTSGDTDDIYISNSFDEVYALASSKSTSCGGTSTTEPITTQAIRSKNKEMVNMKPEDIILSNDTKNIIYHINKVSVVLNVLLGICVFKLLKSARINNKDYQYQSI